MPIVRRAYELLRSRRLAALLLLAVAVWSGLATLVPQDGASRGEALTGAMGWLVRSVGLDRAFRAPIFVGCVMLLFVSTIACAVERTKASVRLWRQSAVPPSADAIAKRADMVIKADEVHGGTTRVVAGLRRMRLRVRFEDQGLVHASSSRLGLFGSPVFHWALALLIALIAAGQLTRSEGLMGVPVGSARVDRHESYGVVTEGPLHRRFTLLTIAVPRIDLAYKAKGIDRGVTPYVELYDGPERICGDHVYPNHPLRYRSLTIHSNDYGLAATFVADDGSATDVLFDFADGECVARSVSEIEVIGAEGKRRLTMSIPLDQLGGICRRALPREVRVQWRAEGDDGVTTGVVKPGESFQPASGLTLTLADAGYYARLSVVDDWSVFPMYVLFAIATGALACAIFMPYREATVIVERCASGSMARVRVRHARRDPAFFGAVREAVERALCSRRPDGEGAQSRGGHL